MLDVDNKQTNRQTDRQTDVLLCLAFTDEKDSVTYSVEISNTLHACV